MSLKHKIIMKNIDNFMNNLMKLICNILDKKEKKLIKSFIYK